MKYEYKGKEIKPIVEYSPYQIYAHFANISCIEYFSDPYKCALSYRIGKYRLRDTLGEYLPLLGPYPYPLSYAHLICLGAEYSFPEGGEPNIKPLYSNIDEAIDALKAKKGMNFHRQPIIQHYIKCIDVLRHELPEVNIPFCGPYSQGPFTSAMLLRGQDFIFDMVDEPDKAKEFLTLLTDSIIEYRHFISCMNGLPPLDPDSSSIWINPPREPIGPVLMDDFAALASPDMWPDFVIPFWNRLFEGITTGTHRFVHCEDMYPQQLKYLKDAKVTYYQPSVSKKLTIKSIKTNTDIFFDWLLYSFYIVDMSDNEIQGWVDSTIEGGVTFIRTQFNTQAIMLDRLDRIIAFYKAFEKYRVE
jgi:hypothetical protein